MPGSAGSPPVMLRADGPAEEDDSKETNIAVALPTTDSTWQKGKKV
jgi:hypothetical protein